MRRHSVSEQSDGEGRRRVDGGTLGFITLLIVFVSLVLFESFGLRPGAGTVPRVIGFPTLVGLLYLWFRELRGGAAEQKEAVAEEPLEIEVDGLTSAGTAELSRAAKAVVAADEDVANDPQEVRRQRWFALWAVGVFLASQLTSFRIAVPIGLFAILVLTGAGWVRSALVTAVTSGFLYVLLVQLLQVRI